MFVCRSYQPRPGPPSMYQRCASLRPNEMTTRKPHHARLWATESDLRPLNIGPCMEVGSLSRTLVPPWDWYDTVMLKKSVPWRERKPMFSCCSWRVVNERYTYLTMVIFESYTSSLTPITNIGASADGAVMMTFLQPPSMCSLAFSSVVKTPVDSITYSTPTLPQGILFGSFLSLTQTRTGHSRENV